MFSEGKMDNSSVEIAAKKKRKEKKRKRKEGRKQASKQGKGREGKGRKKCIFLAKTSSGFRLRDGNRV